MGKPLWTFIINPIAGPGNNRKYWSALRKRLKKRGISFRVKYTKHSDHATRLAIKRLKKEKDPLIVSVGGDGTFNEVASAIVGSEAILAHIPRGSGNGLARMLKLPGKTRKVPGYLLKGTPKNIDAGKINDRYFFCAAGFGFDALVAHHFSKGQHRGLTGYVLQIVKLFFRYKGIEAAFETDDEKHSGRYFMVSIANANQMGNNAYIAPDAKLDDGYLNVTLVRPFPLYYAPIMALALFGKFLNKMPFVEMQKVKTVCIKKIDSPLFHLDGEATILEFPAEIKITESALRILVP